MSNHVGNEGTVKFAANSLAEIRGFEVTEEINTVDDTVMGDSWETHKTTQKRWSGSVNVLWDETDTLGQAACTVGASGTFAMYPEGADSGDTYLTGTGTVESRTITSTHNGIVEMALKVKGNGALSTTTV
jgi:hypothetical protein